MYICQLLIFVEVVNMNVKSINSTYLNTMSLHDVISYRYGVTDIFISDQGTEFVNKIARNLNARAGCTH